MSILYVKITLMKYPSVFLAILLVWISVVVLAIYKGDSDLTQSLHTLLIIFTIAMFLIGFWRNK